jgi:helicase
MSLIVRGFKCSDPLNCFSLNDAFIGVFKIYQKNSEDLRAHRMILLLRYGTMNETIILLIRYGFSMEDVYDLEKYVESISEENIVLTDEIFSAPSYIKNMVKWYLP